ncbi:8-oxo-dGTP diphosphatase [Evansella cellulosilytica]|uniref:NUDIX hydrolase n=1 Tax=Evansella cellulosilytica (strain ATCC 21833 / DSM 2522 / FERM P-1141 / JCM 9156 / N-4) TaxID=649639 RepID=E6TRE1_EVAC2|nr:8-oxo-dGTP diphosphatase [Evansella cellulosilytica]ADU31771.1 NUDIX hydrolase [Evansella cellulosilytica DSM 2522]
MQRVTNCILKKGQHVLTLKKPRRGWWVAPGGKMELGESIRESTMREFYEETGIQVKEPELRGIFTIIIEKDDRVVREWMMFTFEATSYEGTLLKESPEGQLAWHDANDVQQLPMAPGDYHIWEHVLENKGLMYGSFTYTEDFELLSYRLDADGHPIKEYDITKNR